MSHLLRSHAPITEAGWQDIDDEARARVEPGLAARRTVDFRGPHGWEHSAVSLGTDRRSRVRERRGDRDAARPAAGRVPRLSSASTRRSCAPSTGVPRTSTTTTSTAPRVRSSSRRTRPSSTATPSAGITGITEASPHDALSHDGRPETLPSLVAAGVDELLHAGVQGPFALVLGADAWILVSGASEGGFPLRPHIAQIIEGPIVWAPGVNGAVLLSMRGGDFLLDCGQDLSVGYLTHDLEQVDLYLEESLTFRVVSPEAAVAIEVALSSA